MSLLDTIDRLRAFLERNRRVSFRVLQREFDLDESALEELVDELVDIQQVARRNGKALEWAGAAEASTSQPLTANTLTPNTLSSNTLPSEAERRQLTVLFCDLVDSTRLAAALDPEEWREVIRAWQESCCAVVERFAGHVARYLGDGLLVYFGWPQAHEDDAERALRAGLGIVDAMTALNARLQGEDRPALAVRIGVHTGPVVAGELGDETQVLGHTMNLAARLQAEAQPNTVLTSDATLRLVRGIFVSEELGPRRLKGVAEPVALHRVVQPAGVRGQLDLSRGQWTRFVGREQELGLLIERWEQAAEGEGQTIFLTGEAGLGKSRLALMLRERMGVQPHTWLECRSSPYTQGSAFSPVIELVEQGLQMTKEEPAAERLRKLEVGIELARLERATVVPLMAALLGIPTGEAYPALQLSPELQRARTLESLVRWALALAEIQPLLLLVEDLHWCDPSSLELLGRLNEQLPTSRALMVLTARPEFAVPWGHPKRWTPIGLGRLRQRVARELVLAVVGERTLPAAAVSEILERADGVPLYLEELTRAAVESEAAGAPVTIPATLQDSLMARLDRLSAAKEVAQIAAVLGREFAYGLLVPVAELEETALRQSLARLVEADLLFERGTPPEATYTFKHALVQEAAYGSLLKRRREALHARAARALEERFPERAAAEPELLALHCDKGQLFEEATRSYLRAAESSATRSAHAEAVSHFERCLDLLKHMAEGPERNGIELTAQTGLGMSLQLTKGFTSEDATAAYARAKGLCEIVEDPNRLLAALYGLTAAEQTLGQLDRSTDSARSMCKHAERTGRRLDRIAGYQLLGASLYCRGQFRQASVALATALEGYSSTDGSVLVEVFRQDVGLVAKIYNSQNLWCLGKPDGAAEEAKKAVDAARLLKDPLTLAFISAFAATVFGLRRERLEIERLASETIRVSESYGFPLFVGVGRILLGWAHAGDTEAVQEIQQGMALAGETGNQGLVPLILGAFSDTCHSGDRFDEAISAAELGLTLAEHTGQRLWDAELLRRKAEALLQKPDAAKIDAEGLLQRAVEIARSQEAKSLELRAATSLARLWRDQGRPAEAHALLQPVYDWFTEGFDTLDLKDAKALLEELE